MTDINVKEMDMEQNKKKTINHYMRSLHRDIGFFVIGLVIIYSISGVVLIYRDTNFFKQDTIVEKVLSPNIEISELGSVLRIRDFQVIKIADDIVYFQNGTYNKTTGIVIYSNKELPKWIKKFNSLHKAPSKNLVHWFTTTFGILLFFLALSSFWMFKPKTKLFRRGMFIAASGFIVAIILLML